MKKVVVLVLTMLFVSSVCQAGLWKNTEFYPKYKALKAEAEKAGAAGDTTTAIAKYKEAKTLSEANAAPEVSAWLLNNAAFLLIKKFKEATSYDQRIAKLSEMKPSKEKIAYQKEISAAFKDFMGLIDEAGMLLEEGKALNAGDGPNEKIDSNLSFVNWVKSYMKDNPPDSAK